MARGSRVGERVPEPKVFDPKPKWSGGHVHNLLKIAQCKIVEDHACRVPVFLHTSR